MGSASSRLIDIAEAVETLVDDHAEIAGLDRSGRCSTIGPGRTVEGVRVARTVGGEISVRVEVIGLPGTRLPEVADRIRTDIRRMSGERGEGATVLVVVSDLAERSERSEES